MTDKPCQRILVRAPNWVGDAVMALPFFESLRRNAPDAQVTCLCRGEHLEAFYRSVSAIDRVIRIDKRAGKGLLGAWRNATVLRENRHDLAVCLPNSFGSALMLWLARIPRRVGYATEGRRWLLTDALPYGRNGSRPHRSEGYLRLLDLVWPSGSHVTELRYDPGNDAREQAERVWTERLGAHRGLILALAPGVGRPNGQWAPSRFARLAQRWISERRGPVLLLGSRDERTLCDEVSRGIEHDHVINLAGEGNLPVVADLIRRCDLFVGNDSGLGHLAAAVGMPAIVIFGPGDPNETRPLGDRITVVRQPPFCAPCYRNTCWRRDKPLECLDLVSVDDVWGLVESISQRRHRGL